MNTRFNTDTLVNDLKTVVRDSEKLLAEVADASGEKAAVLREQLSESIAKAKCACQKLEEKTKDSLKAADEVVRQHPYESIGVALAVGVVIGALVARK